MNYIIWGVGKRGKKAFRLIGEENVIAFVDSDISKIGFRCCEKPIITIEEAITEFPDCILVITPANGTDEIVEMLEHKNFYRYFRLDDCPLGISLDDEEQDIFKIYSIGYKSEILGLYGINLFTLLLYKYYRKCFDADIILVSQKNLNSQLKECILKEYRLVDLEESFEQINKLLIIKDGDEKIIAEKKKNNVEIMEIDSYLEQNISVFNEDILRFKNIHKGKRCFIVATGPSLRVEDLEVLYRNNEICISMNRIYNIFNETLWRPDYYVIEDAKMIEDLTEEIANLELQNKFVASNPSSYWMHENARGSIGFNMIVQDYKTTMPGFSSNVERCVYNGRTVTYVCLQLAAYMGFSEVYLLGVDFNYSANLYAPENHFKGYHDSNKKVRLNPICPEKMILAYEKAKLYGELHNIKIYNATHGGKLEVFERVDFNKLF